MLANAFGHFDPSGRRFTITDPRTPTPWVNVVCNGPGDGDGGQGGGGYGFVVSQNGGGFSWLGNSQLNVLTRWEMDLVRDSYGKFLYAADLETGDVWSLSPAPCRTAYQQFSCTHTMGSTTFTTEHHGIRAVWTMAVAPGDPVEIWTVELINLQKRERRLRVSSFFEWCCGVAPDTKREFHRLFFTTRHDSKRRAIFATKNMWDVPPRNEAEHWNRPWPYVAAHAVGGSAFERDLALADKGAFLGRYGDPASPAAMKGDGAENGPVFGRFVDAAAALGGDLRLAAGAHVKLHYLIAAAPSEEAVTALIDRYLDPAAAANAVRQAGEAWEKRLAPTRVSTEGQDFDLLTNHWLPYQAISGRIWGRTGYYQQSGAYGFRDQLQDSQVWLTLDPARTRQQLLLHAAHQFADGSVFHWWHPLTETGLRTQCSDDYLWLPFVVCAYLKETGDFQVLQERAPFADNQGGAPLLEHCRRALARSFSRFSPRGLPLIGSCDWNDGLSAAGVLGRGESVWLAQFLCSILQDWAVVCERTGDAAGAADSRARRERLVKAINDHAWDGQWFRGATLDDGRWLGSSAATGGGQIFLNTQTWAILADAADPQRTATAWRAAKDHLLSPWGPLLLSPAYTEPDAAIGYITRYSPGSRENGGVYMHAATWGLAAACKMGDVEAASRIWKSISPPLRSADAPATGRKAGGIGTAGGGGPEEYKAEPYVLPGNVDGPLSDTPGKAGWTWYTGSAAWLRKVALDWMLGIRATWEGLEIRPCPPKELGRVDVTRRWRGRDVRIRFDARHYVGGVGSVGGGAGAEPRLVVNGAVVDGCTLRPTDIQAAGVLEVEVVWPAGSRPGPGDVELKPGEAKSRSIKV
jgi:cellobiose phosphorylase